MFQGLLHDIKVWASIEVHSCFRRKYTQYVWICDKISKKHSLTSAGTNNSSNTKSMTGPTASTVTVATGFMTSCRNIV